MAAAILRRRFEHRDVTASVTSAGFREPDRPASDGVVRALATRGLDAADHRSRRIEADLVREADLVIAMERAHVREIVLLDPGAWSRTFTIKELARRGRAVGPRQKTESLRGWLARIGVGRRREDLLGSSPDDDVRDPMGGALEDYEATADQLDALLGELVELAWPSRVT